jgi:hypothetical protein
VGADVLSKLGFDWVNIPPGVFIHELHHPSIRASDSSSITQCPKELDREVAFIDYIQEHKLPPNIDPKSAEATRIIRVAKDMF